MKYVQVTFDIFIISIIHTIGCMLFCTERNDLCEENVETKIALQKRQITAKKAITPQAAPQAVMTAVRVHYAQS